MWRERWVFITSNLYIDGNVDEVVSIMRRAKQAGYTGVLFDDYKTFTWWRLRDADRWESNAREVRRAARGLGLTFTVGIFPFGRSSALLSHDVNLASGVPVRDAPFRAGNGTLVPERTAAVSNGSFENHNVERAAGYLFQDGPGRISLIDSDMAKHGRVSLRIEAGADPDGGLGRICQEIAVQPWQQYSVRVWMRAEDLSAGNILLLVTGKRRTLQWQDLGIEGPDGFEYFKAIDHLTFGWIEQRVAFNSLENSKVLVYAGVWDGRGGRLWLDDLRIEPAPALNVLRRRTLPFRITGRDSIEYREGEDFERVADPHLGRARWPGTYDTRHEPPVIRLTPDSRIREGERVYISCYHAAIVHAGQIGCSLNDPGVFSLCEEQVRRIGEVLDPDGLFMLYDEIRCAGWEPSRADSFPTSGALLAAAVERCTQIAAGIGKRRVYVWSDMFDPHHNARSDYYLVANTLERSWEGLPPRVVVMNWNGTPESLEFFAGRGHRQMLAAYYDGDPAADHRRLERASRGVRGVTGVMYTTWRNDYSDLESFAEIWWGARSE